MGGAYRRAAGGLGPGGRRPGDQGEGDAAAEAQGDGPGAVLHVPDEQVPGVHAGRDGARQPAGDEVHGGHRGGDADGLDRGFDRDREPGEQNGCPNRNNGAKTGGGLPEADAGRVPREGVRAVRGGTPDAEPQRRAGGVLGGDPVRQRGDGRDVGLPGPGDGGGRAGARGRRAGRRGSGLRVRAGGLRPPLPLAPFSPRGRRGLFFRP